MFSENQYILQHCYRFPLKNYPSLYKDIFPYPSLFAIGRALQPPSRGRGGFTLYDDTNFFLGKNVKHNRIKFHEKNGLY